MIDKINQYIERPWGNFVVLTDFPNVTKRITVRPGKRLSYQSHLRRSEKWKIEKGEGIVIIDDKTLPLKPGDIIEIPVQAKHRIENISKSNDLVVFEESFGFFDENDIERYQDDFGRAK